MYRYLVSSILGFQCGGDFAPLVPLLVVAMDGEGASILSRVEEHPDLVALLASHLDLSGVGRLACVDRTLRTIISSTNDAWEARCSHLWDRKVYVPLRARKLRASGDARAALRLSIEDAERTWLTDDELCAFDWNFRFKASAGESWTEEDPYWNDLPPTRVRFEMPTAAGGEVGGEADGAESRGTMKPSGFEMLEHRSLRWQWAKGRGEDVGGDRSRLELYVDGRKVPTYHVARHSNWGFLMQSCWVLYTSFPMPVRGTDPSLDDEALEITIERQSREARAYNTGLFYDPAAEVDGGAGSADGEQRVVVSLSNGQTAELPLWLLQHLVLAQNGELEAEHDGSCESENGDDESEMAELKVNA